MMYGWGYNHGYDVWGFVSWLIMMSAVVLVIALVVRQLTASAHASHHHGHMGPADGEDALAILKKRYAKGEIDKKEYLEKKKDLTE